MLSRCFLGIAYISFCLAAPSSRGEFRQLMAAKQHEALTMHAKEPFPSSEELVTLSKSELVQLVLSMSGQTESQSEPATNTDSFTYGWPPVWPHPRSFTNGTGNVTVNPDLAFTASKMSDDLQGAFDRTKAKMFGHKAASGGQVGGVAITVDDPTAEVQLETDESYILQISETGKTTITAKTQIGVMHALETFSQLTLFDFDSETYVIQGTPWLITDSPRFKHREILIDTSRHYQPVAMVKQIIDSLTFAKLNVIHWHIVDSPSFPLNLPTYPKLAQHGAFSPQERYTIEDVAEVVEYARARGVRMMVEVDMPGHAASWCAGHPEICPATDCQQPLNPATEATFDLIDGVLNDLTGGARGKGVFFDNMIHLGGDEVNTDCWAKSESIAAWMTAHNYTVETAYYYFVGRAQQIAQKQGRDPVGWEEIWNHFGTKLDKNTIIHQWLPGSTVAQACVKAGYRVLWSTDGVWYLDGLKTNWQIMYKQEPCTNISDADCSQYVLGGGGEMWGETADPSDVQQTIWPRAAAVAERLWSPRDITDPDAAEPRMAAFRCLLTRRGVPAAPISNEYARAAPSGPGSCYAQ